MQYIVSSIPLNFPKVTKLANISIEDLNVYHKLLDKINK